MKKNEKGLTPIIALVVLAILAVLISAGAYYLLKGTGQYPPESSTRPVDYSKENGSTATSDKEIPVSDSDKTSDIEAELNTTDVGEVDSDIDAIESDAGSL